VPPGRWRSTAGRGPGRSRPAKPSRADAGSHGRCGCRSRRLLGWIPINYSHYKTIATEKIRSLDYAESMSTRTVDWTAPARAGRAEGLRERKKRLMRQRLSDTATEMFMERGFDGVRVAEVAAACGVSEKTVFNYFPTKESLVLDRW